MGALFIRRVLFVFMALLCIALPLISLDYSVDRRVPPDLFYVLCVAWLIRDDRTPSLPVIIALALLADVILMRPIGLGALLMLGVSETVRNNIRILRDQDVITEWIIATLGIGAMLVVQNVILTLAFANRLSLGQIGKMTLATGLCYPVVVIVLHYGLRIRHDRLSDDSHRLGRVG